MNLHRMLLERAAQNKPLRIGLIGAGKFGAMYLSQIPTTPGIHLLGIADMSPPRARENLARLGWKPEVTSAVSFAEARRHPSFPQAGPSKPLPSQNWMKSWAQTATIPTNSAIDARAAASSTKIRNITASSLEHIENIVLSLF